MKKRFTAVLAMLVLLLIFVPTAALADDTAGSGSAAAVVTGADGAVTWTIDQSGTLTLSGNGELTESFAGLNSMIKKVVVQGNISGIGEGVFAGCTNLTAVSIANNCKTIGANAFQGCTALTSVSIGNGVTTIGDYAFYGCSALKSVSLGSSLNTIGAYAFSGCSKLTGVTLPGSLTTISGYAFQSCSSLGAMTIPVSLTDIAQNAFANSGLTSVTFQAGTTTIQENAFSGCSRISVVTIPVSVTTIGDNAFNGCGSLSRVNYGGQETDRDAITIGSNNGKLTSAIWFYDYTNMTKTGTCGGLTWVLYKDGTMLFQGNGTIPDSDMFQSWLGFRNSIHKVIISSGCTRIGNYAFHDCDGLTSVTMANTVTYLGDYAFAACDNLSDITLSDRLSSTGEYTFSYDNCLKEITIPGSCNGLGQYAFYESGLTNLVLGQGITRIQQYTLCQCWNLKTIEIPTSLSSIEGYNLSWCSLTDVYYHGTKAQWSKVSVDNWAAWGTGIKNATIHYHYGQDHTWDAGVITTPATCIADGVRTYTCADCGEKKTEVIPMSADYHSYDSVVLAEPTCTETGSVQHTCSICGDTYTETSSALGHSYVRTPDGQSSVCSRCSAAKIDECGPCLGWKLDDNGTLTIYGNGAMNDFNAIITAPWYAQRANVKAVVVEDGVTSIGAYAFYYCQALTSVTIPDSVTEIADYAFCSCSSLTAVELPAGVTTIASCAFAHCTALTEVTVPEGLKTIGYGAFYDCEKLSSLTLPATATDIGYGAFAASGITEFVIPDGVTGLYQFMFADCSSLTTITIPASVTEIANSAFDGCSSLKKVVFLGSEDQWNQISIAEYNGWLTSAEIVYMPENASGQPSQLPGDLPGEEPDSQSPFADVQDSSTYYYEPVLWANAENITTGTSDTSFSPDYDCTRAEVITFLYRYAGEPACSEAAELPFTDVETGSFYYDAVCWGYQQGIVSGTSDTTFSPDRTVSRAEFITFLYRYAGEPEVTESETAFRDIPVNAYYADAVLWGSRKGIVNGTESDQFLPDAGCTRAQAVTFLWRYHNLPEAETDAA